MQLRFSKVIIINFSICIAIVLFAVGRVQAQTDSSGASISPLVFELSTDPGKSVENQVKIYNPTSNTMDVALSIEDFIPIGKNGDVKLEEPDENSTYSLASWTTISPEYIKLAPQEEKFVNFSIDVPFNADSGGHYGSIVASVKGTSSDITGSTVESKRSALILLKVSGAFSEELAIKTFNTDRLHQRYPVDFDLVFENRGNVHVKPSGFITVTDMFGNQVEEIEIPQNNVMPGALRQADVKWENNGSFGYYTATVLANYGTGNSKTVTQTITFFILPWKKLLVITSLLLVFIVLLIIGRRRVIKAFKVLIGKEK